MFASQLLRILQTIPSDVKSETCVYDSAEQDMIMDKNQNERLHDSKSLGREADPMAFGNKDIYQLNGLRGDTHPSLFEVKGKDECCNTKFVDYLSMDGQNMTRDSTGEEFQNGLRVRLSGLEHDADSLSSDTNAKDRVQSSPEHECSVAGEEFMHCNENESRDSRSPYIAASDLFEKDNNLFTEKIVLECESPELIVCYKEINYHIVKDICVDEGMPVNGRILADSSKNDQSDHYFPQPLNDDSHCEAIGAVGKELIISDGLTDASLENMKGIIANEHGSEQETHSVLLSQGMPKSPPESSFDKDIAKECDPEDLLQKGKTNFLATSKTVTHASEESFVDRTLPIQEFGTRSFLRSFLNSLDGEENTVKQPPDQVSSGKVVSEGRGVSSAEAGPKEDVQASSLFYSSKVETGNIMFNFNSLAPGVGGDTNGRTDDLMAKSVDSRDVLDHRDAGPDNLSDVRQVHSESSKDRSTGKIHDQSLNIKDGIPNNFSASSQAQCDGIPSNFSASSQAQCVSSKGMSNENSHDRSLDHKAENSISSDGQAVDSNVLKHEHRDPDNGSVVSLRRYDDGESSFSASGPITYSGPIAFSGSVSLRSDGSATSGRSFAFPILQPEWNSSPVRMTKADGRHFRKHKGWRSGILCCRF